MKNKKHAFTMIELVFVIVVLGILAAVAIPRLSQSRNDAIIAKGRADVASIRSAIISVRQSSLIKGDSDFISGTVLNTGGLFGGVLTYAITTNTTDGHWSSLSTSDATATYNYNIGGTKVLFTYTRSGGIFSCDTSKKYCSELID